MVNYTKGLSIAFLRRLARVVVSIIASEELNDAESKNSVKKTNLAGLDRLGDLLFSGLFINLSLFEKSFRDEHVLCDWN